MHIKTNDGGSLMKEINLIEFAESILSEKPEVLSFTCYIWNIEKTIELLNMLKSKN